MIRFRLLLLLSCLVAQAAVAGPPPARLCLVRLRDKAGVAFDPVTYFAPQALARRERQHLPPADSTDFPLRPDYLAQVQARADTVLFASRWLNAVACRATPAQAAALGRLPGVRAVEWLPETSLPPAARLLSQQSADEPLTREQRQLAHRQTASLGGEALRALGLTGRGLRIAVFDVGFNYADEHPAFEQLRRDKRIVATHDFVRNTDDAYRGGDHGATVLSCMAGQLPSGQWLGLAPEAEYLLARTERTHREIISEEIAWLAAAEWADRLGADIINSSLGYTDRRYFREQMDGRTSLVARAANLAARKGILVISSAGNDGDDPRWRLISTPADADSVLAVGGLDPSSGLPLEFSSCGPAAGGRRKPNVAAFGVVIAAASDDRFGQAEGTSFSSPLVAGLAACLWQQHRELTCMEVFRLIEQLGALYPYYDYAQGYGLPQVQRLLRPTTALPTFEFVPTAETVTVVARPLAAWQRARELPLYADSTFAAVPPADDAVSPAVLAAPWAPPGSIYCYWHIADARGRLRRYQVLDVTQRAVLTLPRTALLPGDVLRVHLGGYTAEFRQP